ncbi:MAG: nucleoside-diphosphate sugar epimerase/dehydratase [Gemmatimonadales bacterium]|nr:nucleoside-diphosphate sugar epimerase/dehydratase [Gemmatimonadales bacterium]
MTDSRSLLDQPAEPPRRHRGRNRRALRNRYLAVSDLVGSAAALFLAYCIRFETFHLAPGHVETLVRVLPLALIIKLAIYYRAGLYRRLWRYAGVAELERIVTAAGAAGIAVGVLGIWILPWIGYLDLRMPASVAVIDAALGGAVVGIPRFLFRWFSMRQARRRGEKGKRILIAGAGSAGVLIARELTANSELGLTPVGFVDDDQAKHGQELFGLPVLGPIDRLIDFRERFRVDELIIAMPSAAGSVVREVMRQAQEAGLAARTIPGMFEILSGRVGLSSLRPIQIEDLLRREPVRTDLDRVQDIVTEHTVLVTGAGGSIGGELCRQIASLQPGRLIAMGHGENSIFNITAELTERFPGVEVVPLIADVRDRDRVFRLIETHQPSVIFHAAAHKHVPLMEINVAEAVTNNILGTRNVCEAAAAAGVDRFVMISTDKAVRPTNVMGASKRVAEQLVQEIGANHGRNFIAVRFGNVLGSRGSVVPVFLRQIESGGPVTVTHPEMRRYFMTIPEAVQLVLQAAVLGRGGEVFVLDMGEPVKIVDLATDLIRLSGLEVGRDVAIHFTGVRPGEKLYEELFFGREHAEVTEHPKVLKAKHAELPIGLTSVVEDLIARAHRGAREDDLRELLRRLVPDYRPEGSAHNISSLRGGAPESPAVPLFRDLGSA